MKDVYIAVPCDYFRHNPWPPGAGASRPAMACIWGIPDSSVKLIRTNHPLGDLYRVTVITDEDLTAMRLRSSAGTIVTNIDAIR